MAFKKASKSTATSIFEELKLPSDTIIIGSVARLEKIEAKVFGEEKPEEKQEEKDPEDEEKPVPEAKNNFMANFLKAIQ